MARASEPLELLGIRLVGFNPENGRKLLLSVVLLVAAWAARRVLHALVRAVLNGDRHARTRFWVHQAISIIIALAFVIVLASLWFDDPARLTTALGLVTAGLAFALQRVVTALAGYVVIMRGRTFSVGDRIVMGGVRGDVIRLDFTQTTIMEMGQPPPVQNADPAMWVRSRQYTGRIVTVSNARVFDEPVFNYTREFPYLWEEMMVPVGYAVDLQRAEQILVSIAQRHTAELQQLSDDERAELQRRYPLGDTTLAPKVYVRLTDNWIELTVRFLAREHGVRELKDRISRDLLRELKAAGIGLASATFEVVGLPPLRLSTTRDGHRGGEVSDAPAGEQAAAGE